MSVEEGDSLDDPELLMEVLDARERLEEAGSQAEIDELKEENEGRVWNL